MKIAGSIFKQEERVCVRNALPDHIGGQSPPLFAVFHPICSLFGRFDQRSFGVYLGVAKRFFWECWRQYHGKSGEITGSRGDKTKKEVIIGE